FFFFSCSVTPRHLHSFPTRRSSDLEAFSAEDDHDSFLKRGVAAVDVIGDFTKNGYWHTAEDDLDKISPRTLALVGHVFLESLKQDRKSTRLNSSHVSISYAVFCLKK